MGPFEKLVVAESEQIPLADLYNILNAMVSQGGYGYPKVKQRDALKQAQQMMGRPMANARQALAYVKAEWEKSFDVSDL